MTPFEQLFEDWDDVNELLDGGPDVDDAGANESERFLAEIQAGILKAARQAATLTPADVDKEFTEDDETQNNEQSQARTGDGNYFGFGDGL